MSHHPKINIPFHPSMTLPYHPRIHLPYHPYHPGINIPAFHPHSISPLSMSSLSPSSPSSSSSHTQGPSSAGSGHGFRGMKSKICGVCGDRAKSYHFGGISCDSCKAFFRRSVQNDAYKNFHCPYEAQCDINISSRKCCQFCRFKKCLSIGMMKSWVMTEEERLQMLKARLEKRQKQESTSSSSASSPTSPPRNHDHHLVTREEQVLTHPPCERSQSPFPSSSQMVRTIENLVNHYITSCQEIPLRFPDDEMEEDKSGGRELDDDEDKHRHQRQHLGADERPHFAGLNCTRQVFDDDNLNGPRTGDERMKGEDKEVKGQERKRRNDDDEHEDEEKMRSKKKSSSSSSSCSSPATTTSSSSPVTAADTTATAISRSLQESRQSVSSSCESINVISVDDEEDEQIEGVNEEIKRVGRGPECEEGIRREVSKGMILTNGGPEQVMMSSSVTETNGITNHSSRYHPHNHTANRIDEDEIDLLNSSNSSTCSSTSTSSSSWCTFSTNSSTNFDSNRRPRRSKAKILEILFTSIQQLTSFCRKINCFSQLTPVDQEILLKGCILEMCLLRSGACFDPKTKSWPDPSDVIKSLLSFGSNTGENVRNGMNFVNQSSKSHHGTVRPEGVSLGIGGVKREVDVDGHNVNGGRRRSSSLSIFDVRPLMSQELFVKYTKFIRSIQEMNLDQISVIILCIILLLTPDRIGLTQSSIEFITGQQEKYLLLLQRYMIWKYGHTSASVLFPKLLLKLPDLRELSELLTDYQLVLCKEEVQSVQNKLQQQLIISSPREDRFKDGL